MSGGEFVDTNVLVYAYDADAGPKGAAAQELLRRLFETRSGALSFQILAESYSVMTRKWRMPSESAERILARYSDWVLHSPRHSDLIRASQLERKYRISWWDALIVNSAIQLGCQTLWTEDLADGQQYGPVTVRNPFAA